MTYDILTDYNPRPKTAAALDRAFEMVRSVPYKVSARWVFYRLLQEGWYSKKSDYKNKFLKAVSNARHAFYAGWRPDTLADETRAAVYRGFGPDSVKDWLQDLATDTECKLDKWQRQDNYIELWFEARAMTDQFRHYTKYIPLRPMGGQPSIPYKWQAAKELEWASSEYDNPVTVLYFGDLDLHGGIISDVAERDVREWCNCDFDFIRCGLNLDQVQRFGVPENPEKPGEYQWEALSDDGAREIIKSNVEPFLRLDAFTDIEQQEQDASEWLHAELAGLVDKWQNNGRLGSDMRGAN